MSWKNNIAALFTVIMLVANHKIQTELCLLKLSHPKSTWPLFAILFLITNLISRSCTFIFTTSWGCWKHSFWIPGARPMFLKPKLHKESKNGFKTISCRPYPVMIFSKNCFWCKKIIKKIGRFDDFWTLMAMYMITLHQFKKK